MSGADPENTSLIPGKGMAASISGLPGRGAKFPLTGETSWGGAESPCASWPSAAWYAASVS